MGVQARIFGKAEPARTRRFDRAAGGRRGFGMGTFGRNNPETAAAGPALRSPASYLAMNAPFIANAIGNWVGARIGARDHPFKQASGRRDPKSLECLFSGVDRPRRC